MKIITIDCATPNLKSFEQRLGECIKSAQNEQVTVRIANTSSLHPRERMAIQIALLPGEKCKLESPFTGMIECQAKNIRFVFSDILIEQPGQTATFVSSDILAIDLELHTKIRKYNARHK